MNFETYFKIVSSALEKLGCNIDKTVAQEILGMYDHGIHPQSAIRALSHKIKPKVF